MPKHVALPHPREPAVAHRAPALRGPDGALDGRDGPLEEQAAKKGGDVDVYPGGDAGIADEVRDGGSGQMQLRE